MQTYINKKTGQVINTELTLSSEWSALTRVIKNGKEELSFDVEGATVKLIEVKDGDTNAA